MRSKVVGKKEKYINWDIPNLVESKDGQIMLTNGKHTETSFEAMVIVKSEKSNFSYGLFYNKWSKIEFTLCEYPITITFEY